MFGIQCSHHVSLVLQLCTLAVKLINALLYLVPYQVHVVVVVVVIVVVVVVVVVVVWDWVGGRSV